MPFGIRATGCRNPQAANVLVFPFRRGAEAGRPFQRPPLERRPEQPLGVPAPVLHRPGRERAVGRHDELRPAAAHRPRGVDGAHPPQAVAVDDAGAPAAHLGAKPAVQGRCARQAPRAEPRGEAPHERRRRGQGIEVAGGEHDLLVGGDQGLAQPRDGIGRTARFPGNRRHDVDRHGWPGGWPSTPTASGGHPPRRMPGVYAPPRGRMRAW